MKKVIILRGLPGSGKSELSWMFWKGMGATICSADFFFDDGDDYNFDAAKLSEAHDSCRSDFVDACLRDEELIVVDNTNTTYNEMADYNDIALGYGYMVHFVIVENREGSVSSHSVPQATINKMRQRFDVSL